MLCLLLWTVGGVAAAAAVAVIAIKLLISSNKQAPVNKDRPVVVVGGGIAGCSAAFALVRSGYTDVTLLEGRHVLGGNARTQEWPNGVTTGLSVLAWPSEYFRNYSLLLNHLKVDTQEVDLPFLVHDCKNNVLFEHGKYSRRFEADLRRWRRMVEFVRKVTNLVTMCSDRTFYKMSMLNPCNVMPTRLLSRFFGVSSEFWDVVVVSVYSSSFLTSKLDSIPSVILPALTDLMPLDGVPKLATWSLNSKIVFKRMTEGVKVELGQRVVAIRPVKSQNEQTARMVVETESGDTFEADAAILACNADASANMLRPLGGGWRRDLRRKLLSSVGYADDDDHSFTAGIIHSDKNVMPRELRDKVLAHNSNYIAIQEKDDGTREYINTFVLSSWVPQAVEHAKPGGKEVPMLVTYNSEADPNATVIDSCQGSVDNRRGHPHLSVWNLGISQALKLVQGTDHVYLCGAFTTPGNGHDLSLLSGFAAACAIGAVYPFDAHNSEPDQELQAARRDFQLLRGLMSL